MKKFYNLLLKKVGLIFLFFVILSNLAFAAYLQFVPTTVRQPDGCELNIFASGDEYYNWLHDKDGYTIVQDGKGYFVYADKRGNELVTTAYIVGQTNPSTTGLDKWIKIPASEIEAIAKDFKNRMMPPKPIISSKTDNLQVANTGTINNLVVFIRFSGESEFTDATSTYNNLFNASSGNSMVNYFKEVSYNQLTINSAFYPIPSGSTVISFQDAHTRGYFQPYSSSNTIGYTGGNNGTQRRDREHTLLVNAVNYVNAQIPVSLNIDNDNDGYVDNVCFIVSGTSGAWSSLLWPHRWSLYSQTVTINGKIVYDYNFQIRDMTLSSGVGVLCHEMFHTLGSPDLYHYSSNGIAPVYQWDLMENNSNPPQHMGNYMKYRYGKWISTIDEITSSGVYTLNPVTSPTNNCFKIKSSNSTTEYFIVEYRKKAGTFENSIPGSGLLVYRINSSYDGQGNSNGPPDEVYIYRPGGTTSANGTPANANFSSEVSRTAINNSTNPSAFLSNGSAGYLDISQVGTSSGNTISFRVTLQNPNLPSLLTPSNNSVDINMTPAFTWNSFTGAISYTLQLSTVSDFSTKVIDQSGITGTMLVSPVTLTSATDYYWRINARLPGGTTDWSNVFTFRTASGTTVDTIIGKLCAGSYVTIHYTANTTYDGGNVFTAQLSDSLGKFKNPVDIGSVIATISGTITALIPDSTSDGSHYRIRVTSSQPATIGVDNGSDLVINALLNAFINGDSVGCIGKIQTYSTSKVTNIINEWRIKGGRILSNPFASVVDVSWDSLGSQKLMLTKTSTSGCKDSVVKIVKVYNSPAPAITGDTLVCEHSVLIYYPKTDPDMNNGWVVTGGKVTAILGGGIAKVEWDTAGKGTITLTQTNKKTGCSNPVTRNIHIITKPNPGPISGELTVCPNSEKVYSVQHKNGYTNSWTVTGGTISGNANLDSIKVKWVNGTPSTLKIVQTAIGSGCKDSVVKTIIIKRPPDMTISGAQAACAGLETVYSVPDDSGAVNKWVITGGILNSSDTGSIIKVLWNATGNSSITLTRYSTLTGCSDSVTINVTIGNVPPKPTITRKGDNLESSADAGNQWFFQDSIIPGATSKGLTPTIDGIYNVQITLNKCTSEKSDQFNFTKLSVTEPLAENESIRIWPNPNDGKLYYSFRNAQKLVNSLKVLNLLGETLINMKSYDNSSNDKSTASSIDLNRLNNGVYIIYIQAGEKSYRERIVLYR